jgi:hypothetical protein
MRDPLDRSGPSPEERASAEFLASFSPSHVHLRKKTVALRGKPRLPAGQGKPRLLI